MLKEKEGMVPALVLTVVCVITGLLLALTSNVTKDKIALAEQNAAMEQMKTLLPDSEEFIAFSEDEIKNISEDNNIKDITGIFEAKKGGETKGYIFTSQSKGYGGVLPIMVGIDKSDTITGISVLTNEETPGLGKKVESEDFTAQFKGKPAGKNFNRNPKDSQQQFDAVTGATISSGSVMSSVNKVLKAYKAISK